MLSKYFGIKLVISNKDIWKFSEINTLLNKTQDPRGGLEDN